MGRHLRNLIRHVHTFNDFTKHRIAKITLAMIEEGVIRNIDKELAGGAVLIGGTRHGDGATRIAQAVVGFVFNRWIRLFLLHLLVKAAALHHKARDHPVKSGVVIKAAVHVLEEVIHRDRCFLAIQLKLNIARRRGQQHMGIPFCRHGRGEC